MDAKEFKKANPDIKLGEFIEEDIPVKSLEFDPQTKKVSMTTNMEKQKVMYIDAPKEMFRCKSGAHIFESLDPHRGLFGCTICPFKRMVYPTTYKFENGKLIHKITGKVV